MKPSHNLVKSKEKPAKPTTFSPEKSSSILQRCNNWLLTLIGILFCIVPIKASESFTYSYEGQTLNYEIISDSTCAVSSNNYGSNNLIIPAIAIYNGKEYSVTEIVAGAFGNNINNNSQLYSVTIPTTVTKIGAGAFYYCANLNTLYFNAENCISCGTSDKPAFHYLGKIYIGKNVKSIPDYAFKGCNGPTSITIPNSVSKIGASAFNGCSGLTSVTIPNSVTEIGNGAFYGCSSLTSVTIPNSVSLIGSSSFNNCKGLTSINVESDNRNYASADGVLFNRNYTELIQFPTGKKGMYTIPASVTEIGNGAFYSCTGLTSVTIPNSVTEIGSLAFYGCNSLTSMEIPSLLTEIGEGVFSWCTGLTSITIPDSVTKIGNSSFSCCTSLTSISIPNSVSSFGNNVFSNCTELSSVSIPNSVTEIGASAFYGCSSLTSVTIPDHLTEIKDCTFAECTGLQSVIISDSVTEIGYAAFFGCSSLTSVTIPASVTAIGADAFDYCERIKNLIIEDGDNELTLGSCLYYNMEGQEFTKGLFYYCPLETLYLGRNLKYETTESDTFSPFDNQTALTELTIGNSVTSIGANTFYDCSGLTSVNSPSIESWLSINFDNKYANPTYYTHKLLINNEQVRKITIPANIRRINAFAFINCEPLITVTFPASITSIGTDAFRGCSGLQRAIFPTVESYLGINYDDSGAIITSNNKSKIYIGSEEYSYPEDLKWPESITRIPDYAFYKISTIKQIDIPQSVTEIGCQAFYQCSGLNSVTIPNSVTSIASDAFKYCRLLKSIKIMDINNWSKIDFENIYSNPLYYAKTFTVGVGDEPVKHLDIDVREAGVSPFAFYNAQNLETVRVAGDHIGSSAFQNCTNLKQICIAVDSISQNAFNNNSNLENIYCMKEVAPAAFDNTFSKYDGVKLYVPHGSIGRYENAENCWCQFLDIYESDFSGLNDIFNPDYTTGKRDILNGLELSDSITEVYNLNGVKIADPTENLRSGIYIRVCNGKATRIMVK